MTQCNNASMNFSSFDGRKIEANFDGGTITSDAGGLLLSQADHQLQLLDRLDDCIPDPRQLSQVIHSQRSMLAQRIFGIALGYEDVNDHQTLRDDLLHQTLCERTNLAGEAMASPSTLNRLENRSTITRSVLRDMAEVLVETFIASHKKPPKELVLDFDATDDLVHGHQAKRFFHGYYDAYCYLPLYVFCDKQLLVAYLRPSNIDGAKHSWAILSLLVKSFRQVWPDVRIVFRGDSAFCRYKMLRWCDRNDVYYIIGIAKNPVLKRNLAPYVEQAEQQFKTTQEPLRVFGEFQYAAVTWNRKRRVIAKAEHFQTRVDSRCIITNLEGDAKTLYEDVYCARGEMENRIKEQQLHLFADRTSCSDFLANQFRLLLSAAAYVLIDHIRRVGLVATEFATATVETIRLKVLKIGAIISQSVRRIVLQLSSSYPYQHVFRVVLMNLGPPCLAWPCRH